MALGMGGLVMTVDELIRELQKYNGNQEVVVCNYVYENQEIVEFRYFKPSVEVWDVSIPTDSPENLVSIYLGDQV